MFPWPILVSIKKQSVVKSALFDYGFGPMYWLVSVVNSSLSIHLLLPLLSHALHPVVNSSGFDHRTSASMSEREHFTANTNVCVCAWRVILISSGEWVFSKWRIMLFHVAH